MRIYLSGPITGVDNYRINFLTAEYKARAHFKRATIINPTWLVKLLPDGKHDEYLEICYSLVGMADKMILLPGWEKSKGACAEKKMAEEMGIDVLELGASGEIKGQCI